MIDCNWRFTEAEEDGEEGRKFKLLLTFSIEISSKKACKKMATVEILNWDKTLQWWVLSTMAIILRVLHWLFYLTLEMRIGLRDPPGGCLKHWDGKKPYGSWSWKFIFMTICPLVPRRMDNMHSALLGTPCTKVYWNPRYNVHRCRHNPTVHWTQLTNIFLPVVVILYVQSTEQFQFPLWK